MSRSQDIFAPGLGLEEPWMLLDQHLDPSKQPHELHLRVGARRGAWFPCPTCGRSCKARDFKEMIRRHLNFFQHQCDLTAAVPRVNSLDHGVKLSHVPWVREGSSFTLLIEQAAVALVCEMPVKAATPQAARWRLTRFLNHADEMAAGDHVLAPVRKAIATVRQQIARIIQRWYSTHSNARREGLTSIFQAARHRARGDSRPVTFIAMIYLLVGPIGDITKCS